MGKRCFIYFKVFGLEKGRGVIFSYGKSKCRICKDLIVYTSSGMLPDLIYFTINLGEV